MEFFGKTLSGPFTIPSGIVTTATPIIQYIFDHMPEVGVVTTKSIGLEPRAGNREPVYSQYAPGCFVNAIGLTNPGAQAAREIAAVTDCPIIGCGGVSGADDVRAFFDAGATVVGIALAAA